MVRFTVGLVARVPAYVAGAVFGLRCGLARLQPEFLKAPTRAVGGCAGGTERQTACHALVRIGYWHVGEDDGLPHPQALVDWGWEPVRRWKIVRYLESGRLAAKYMGWSYCRIGCWRTFLGTLDLTDGVWVWPEGLAHYVAFHGVRLPDEFVAYAAIDDFRIAVEPGLEHVAPNWETFWEDWAREHARFDYEPNCLACAELRREVGPAFFSGGRCWGAGCCGRRCAGPTAGSGRHDAEDHMARIPLDAVHHSGGTMCP